MRGRAGCNIILFVLMVIAIVSSGCQSNKSPAMVLGQEEQITQPELELDPSVLESGKREPAVVMSLLGSPLMSAPPENVTSLEGDLADARLRLAKAPDDSDAWIWVGRRLGYLWRMSEAVDLFSQAIEQFPDDARFYRHRGHRYISLRQFDEAIVDLTKAADLMGKGANDVEPDGKPNARNLPLTTLGYNVWYHLGVAYYLTAQFEESLDAFARTKKYGRGLDDNIVSTTDWMYLCLRRLGRSAEARKLLTDINPDMDIIENHAYHRRLLMYKGMLPASALEAQIISDLDAATMGYGLGMWYWLQGNPLEGKTSFDRVISGRYWPAFGYIAAEAELARATASE